MNISNLNILIKKLLQSSSGNREFDWTVHYCLDRMIMSPDDTEILEILGGEVSIPHYTTDRNDARQLFNDLLNANKRWITDSNDWLSVVNHQNSPVIIGHPPKHNTCTVGFIGPNGPYVDPVGTITANTLPLAICISVLKNYSYNHDCDPESNKTLVNCV